MEPSLKHLLNDEKRQNYIELVMAWECGGVLGVHIDTGPEHPPYWWIADTCKETYGRGYGIVICLSSYRNLGGKPVLLNLHKLVHQWGRVHHDHSKDKETILPLPDQAAGWKHHLTLFDHIMLALLVCLTYGHVFSAEQIRADIHTVIWSVLIFRLLLSVIVLFHSLVEVLFLVFANQLAICLKLAREVYAKPYSAN